MRGIRKSFAGIEVLKGVEFDVVSGEVHALVGENGAGKSTLMNILAGVLRPDAGEITFRGRTCAGFASAHAAQQQGVSMVFQEGSLFGPLSVAENIFAGRQPVTGWGMIDRRRLDENARRVLAEVAPEVDPRATVSELSSSQRQMVEIAKALSLDARLLILDEPTAALTEAETARLFGLIRRLRERGAGIAYISHRLEEVFALGDRVTVLKDGAWQGTMPVPETTADELIRRMIGRNVETAGSAPVGESSPALLEVRGLSDPPASGRVSSLLRDVSFEVRAGEIVGLAGLAGAGRTETAHALFGASSAGRGRSLPWREAGRDSVALRGDCGGPRLRERRPQGLRIVPRHEPEAQRERRATREIRNLVFP